MVEVRFHGRGGQGVVTASRLLAEAALLEGKRVQGFPAFGAEREGAPIRAFTRISSNPIRVRSQIYTPDVVVVLDPTVIRAEKVTEGLKDDGWLIANTTKEPEELKAGLATKAKVVTVDATRIALELLGAPRVNTPILGTLVKATQLVKLDSVIKVVKSTFSGRLAEVNIKAVERAYHEAKI
ncbi:MAG: pyruvate ferredoxin oxidoreductase subunit gamma [Candidatus Freyarchaeota archaeon]|nr:pyruvate ferredoxin oxidoreductase subunit gamma [Candidatus Jordarchaeia archaeon]